MTLLDEIRLQPHTRHRWEDEVRPIGPITHARLNIFPDGGVARLRLWGTLASPPAS
jgi:allantoicase